MQLDHFRHWLLSALHAVALLHAHHSVADHTDVCPSHVACYVDHAWRQCQMYHQANLSFHMLNMSGLVKGPQSIHCSCQPHGQQYSPVSRWQIWNAPILLFSGSADINNDSIAICGHCVKGCSRADVACIPSESSKEALQEGRSLHKHDFIFSLRL